jgi:hypothetical protein
VEELGLERIDGLTRILEANTNLGETITWAKDQIDKGHNKMTALSEALGLLSNISSTIAELRFLYG